MTLTLTGVFDEAREAQAAIEQIRRLGIAECDIRAHWGSTGLSGLPGVQSAEHRGFFPRLFGKDGPDERTGHVAEAARRGATVVSVHLPSEEKADEVERILELAGAIDLDERVQAWQAGGYVAYDPASPALSVQALARDREQVAAFGEEVRLGKRPQPVAGTRVLRRNVADTAPAGISSGVGMAQGGDGAGRAMELHPGATAEAAGSASGSVRGPGTAELRAFDAGEQVLEFIDTREEAVVRKQARVVEEILIDTHVVETVQTLQETLHRMEVDIERFDPDPVDAARLSAPSSSPSASANRP